MLLDAAELTAEVRHEACAFSPPRAHQLSQRPLRRRVDGLGQLGIRQPLIGHLHRLGQRQEVLEPDISLEPEAPLDRLERAKVPRQQTRIKRDLPLARPRTHSHSALDAAAVHVLADEFRQFSLADFNLGSAVYNARVTVKVVSGTGRVTAYGSAIDAITQDPTYIPAQ